MNRFSALVLVVAGMSVMPLVQADARIDETTNVQLGGSLGKISGFLGGKRAKEGTQTEVRIKGNRMLTVHGRTGELIDLDAEKVYQIDFKRRRYQVETFAEHRQRIEQLKEQFAGLTSGGSGGEGGDPAASSGPEYEAEVAIDETGRKEMIAGQSCKEVVVTITLHPKGQSLEEGGGAVLTARLWQGPELPEMRERQAFQRHFAEKLGLQELVESEGRSMTGAMIGSPAVRQALEEFRKKRESFEGVSYRTEVSLDTVGGTAPPPGGEPGAEGEEGKSLGGMLRGLGKTFSRKRRSREGEGAGPGPGPGAGGRAKVFGSTTRVVSVSDTVADDEVALPAGFKQKKLRR